MAFVDFNNLVNDDGTGTVGTLIDVAEIKGLLMGAAPLTRNESGTVHNWAPGLAGHTYVEWNGSADLTITGIASSGYPGQSVVVRNIGTAVIYFSPGNTNSAANNRLWHSSNAFALAVAPGGWIAYRFGPQGIWMLVGHEQGRWVDIPYAAGNFTGNGSMTWTVEAADQTTLRYRISGLSAWLNFYLSATSVGGALNTDLRIALPAGWTIYRQALEPFWAFDNGARLWGAASIVSGGNAVILQKLDASAWTASTNGTYVAGVVQFELT